ncbi:MAG TPA: hypothetical protein VFB79_18630 [Candidatus Angelobacter sp.]|nr:hypothetical protein [Candidatus Angelobacter sp.]
MKKLKISHSLALPADAVTQTLIVFGGKGMGKTNFATVLAEEFSAVAQRFSIIDAVGVFYGLRHSADGKGPGIEVVILGGTHGDIPIEPTGGAVVADFVADEDVDTIIDISRHPSGKMWTVSERIKFVADYCTRLYERQGERRRPLMQIIDEAARFVPQQIPHGAIDIARCSGAVSILVEEGRNVGIGVCLLTQRSARMNKAVTELADCMISFRIVGPLSIKAVLDWFGEHVEKSRWKELLEQLRKLPRGNALVVSPGWLGYEGKVLIRERKTFDSSATPESGHERRARGKGAKPDLTRYLQRMKETIERQKENDPKELKRRIVELEQQLKSQPAPAKADASTTAEFRILQRKHSELLRAMEELMKVTYKFTAIGFDKSAINPEELKDLFDAVAASIARHTNTKMTQRFAEIEKLKIEAVRLQRKVSLLLEEGSKKKPEAIKLDIKIHNSNKRTESKKTVSNPTQQNGDTNVDLPPAKIKLLNSIAAFESIGMSAVPKPVVAVFAKVSPSSSGFENNMGALRSAGFIEYPKPGTASLTETGRSLAQPPDTPASAEELLQRIESILPPAKAKIIRSLATHYPDPVAKDDLAREVNVSPTSSGYENNLGALRSMGMLDYPAPKQVQLAPWVIMETE